MSCFFKKHIKRIQALLNFFGWFMHGLTTSFINRPPLFKRMLAVQVYQNGIKAIPVVLMTTFVVGIVLSYEGIGQLAKFGAENSIVTVVSLSVFREAAALITGIVVAGRSGSAFAAELGAMVLNEETAAFETMGLDVMKIHILPRTFALLLSLPILTLCACLSGLVGAGMVCLLKMDMTVLYFVHKIHTLTDLGSVLLGFSKTPVFALIISLVSAYQGMAVRKSTVSLGQKTTQAVVSSIVLIILWNSFFSTCFSHLF